DAKLALKAAQAKHKLAKADVKYAKAEFEAAETNFKYPVQLEALAAEAKAEAAKVETLLAELPFKLEQAVAELTLAKQILQSQKTSGATVAGIELDRAQSKVDVAQAMVKELAKRQELLGFER